ncbi:MAG: hypothetical protein M5R36_02870 [Deltaproteobacteria bacterium]|nr:hypothetical protein [Deltaproteobacteria bacterium]
MEQLDMVRCFLSRSPDEQGDVRYTPLEIFTLWRFLMERVHNLHVQDPVVSVWIPEEYAEGEDGDAAEKVIEVSFKYMEREGVGRPITRYFPEENFDMIFGYFRKHFSEENILEGVQHRKGVFAGGESARPYVGTE